MSLPHVVCKWATAAVCAARFKSMCLRWQEPAALYGANRWDAAQFATETDKEKFEKLMVLRLCYFSQIKTMSYCS